MKIKGNLSEVLTSENCYEESVENFDILTEKMEDDFKPYRIEQNVMMWLDDDGLIGEIECIFPDQIEDEILLTESDNVLVQDGFPLIDTEESVEATVVRVFKSEEYFILYISETKEYNRKIKSENLSFYVNDNELIAIKAKLGKSNDVQ